MKDLKQHILEKLKISKNPSPDITLESLIDALKEYKERKNYEFSVYIDLKEIFEEYPVVLQYHGTYKDQNIVAEKIKGIQLITYDNAVFRNFMKDGKYAIFMYFDRIKGVSLKIENTKELHDIFGEEALTKIYDYIVNN